MKNDLISIIIPCYNASEFILETLSSILAQQRVNIEIIIVNDGSKDDSEQKILSVKDERIKYFFQKNSGVSSARNYGLEKSSGEYIVFFDADDVMSEGFVYSRRMNIGSLDFICGEVKKFTGSPINITGTYRGTSSQVFNEILLYDQSVVTCPSNYLFKSSFLRDHGLKFNISLSSTADRYFLLECARFGRSECVKECAPLLYRVNENSMSHRLSEKLVRDNELFFSLVQKNSLIPAPIKDKSLFLGYYVLCGANSKINNTLHVIKYGVMALLINPGAFLKKIFKYNQPPHAEKL